MKLIQRIGYYLGGFSLGLILLAFFLSGKKTSCDYGPNARTLKNIGLKKQAYSETALAEMRNYSIDSTEVSKLISSGNVNFSQSDTKLDSCNVYVIENEWKDKEVELSVKNCDSVATLERLEIFNSSK